MENKTSWGETCVSQKNNFPKLHNAMWPGLVGKGPDSEPGIELDTLIELTAKAEVGGIKFDGIDIFHVAPHTNIDFTEDEVKRLADKVSGKGLNIGSIVAPVWPPVGGGSAMGSAEQRRKFVSNVEKSCKLGKRLRDLGVRHYGVIRIDSAVSPAEWAKDPRGNTKKIAKTFREACSVASDFGERLAAEGEICWGGMHSWKDMINTLEETDRPQTIGFQADMAHTLLYTMGYNAPKSRLLPAKFDWKSKAKLDEALKKMTDALRPWTIDFHVAQNDGTVKGLGYHDKTGKHCMVTDPNGKLDIPKHAGYWLRDANGELTKAFRHICWDGCMFPNATMLQQKTWNDVLATMIKVRDKHGWMA
jgi:sugar phosphate isomerase/epimerase